MSQPIIHRFDDRDTLIEGAARWLIQEISDAVAKRSECRIALAGGGTPKPLYQRLASPDCQSLIDWNAVRLFYGDERAVGPTDPASNHLMASNALIDAVPIPHSRVHRIPGELEPVEKAARLYSEILGEQPLDIALLGMGGDGHTASLFPGGPELDETSARLVITRSPVPPATRISMTLPVFNNAHRVVLLVAGAGKAERLAEVYAQYQAPFPNAFPVARLRPTRPGALHWFVDNAAASLLP